MNKSADSQLALDGGTAVCTQPLPVSYNGSGRWYGDQELKLVEQAIRSGNLTRWGGKFVDQLEKDWCSKNQTSYAVATSSGTTALHTAVAALALEPGTKVITTPITDAGTLIAIMQNLLIPVFADVCAITGMMTADTIAESYTEDCGAILFVHLFGRCADLTQISQFAQERNIPLIEDASQAHFASKAGTIAGQTADISAFSLQQSKVVSCGEGGIVTSDNRKLAERARLYQNKGWVRGGTGNRAYPFLGHNYRLSELNAAFAVGQLKLAEDIIEARRKTYQHLSELLTPLPGISTIFPDSDEKPSWWAFLFHIDSNTYSDPDYFQKAIQGEGIPFAQGYIGNQPLFMVEMFQQRATFGNSKIPWTLGHSTPSPEDKYMCPNATKFLSSAMTMNWNEGLTSDHIETIAAGVKKVCSHLNQIK